MRWILFLTNIVATWLALSIFYFYLPGTAYAAGQINELTNKAFVFRKVNEIGKNSIGLNIPRLQATGPMNVRPGMPGIPKRFDDGSDKRNNKKSRLSCDKQMPALNNHLFTEAWLWALLGTVTALLVCASCCIVSLRRSVRRLETFTISGQQSHNKLQATLDALPDLLFVLGIDGHCYDCHTPCVEYLTLPPEKLIGKTVFEAMPTEAAEVCLAAVREAYEKGISIGKQFELSNSTEKLWFELSVARKNVVAGRAPRFVVLSRNITERKNAEQQIQMMDFALNSVRESLFIIDKDVRLVHVNKAACQTLGYSREELLGMTVYDIDPDVKEEDFAQIREKADVYGIAHLERRHKTKDGRIFPVEITNASFNFHGISLGVALARDITSRKRREVQEEIRLCILEKIAEGAELSVVLDLVVSYVENIRPDFMVTIVLDSEEVSQSISSFSNSLAPDFIETICGTAFGREMNFRAGATSQNAMAIAEDVRFHPDHAFHECMALMGLLSYWSVPVFDSGGKTLGSFCIYRRETGRPSEEDIELLHRACHLAAIAIERQQIDNARRESERQFRTLAENAPDSIVRFDNQCRMLYVNPAFVTMMGTDALDMVGKTPIELAPGFPQIIKYQTRLKEVIETGHPIEIEIEITNTDGEARHHHIHFVAERDALDNIVGALAIGFDITERKQMEQAIVLREMELRSVMDSSPDTVIRYDLEGRIRYINAKLLSIFRVKATEIVGRLPREAWPDGRFAAIEQAVMEVLATETALKIELRKHIAENEVQIQEIQVVPERGASGEMVGVVAFGRDITNIKRYEQALLERAETERRQSQFFAVSPGYFYTMLLSLEGSYVITFASQGIRDLLGLEPQSLIQDISKFIALVHPDDVEKTYRLRAESARNLTVYHVEYRINHPQKGLRWMESRSLPQRLPDGSTRWHGFMHDVTERKCIEEERLSHLRFLESLDLVNRAIQSANDLESMMSNVLNAVLSIFGCDRAFFTYPCDPDAKTWHVPKECTRPEYPGIFAGGAAVSMDESVASGLRIILDSNGPVKFGEGTEHPLPPDVSERLNIKTFISMALYPKLSKAWQFGIHQCADIRIWTPHEERLLQEIGRRLEDGLTSWLINQDLQVNEQKFRSLAENSPDIIVRYDTECRRTYVNPTFVREMETPLDFALDVVPSLMWRGEIAAEEYVTYLRQVIETGEPKNFIKFKTRKTDGSIHYFNVMIVPEWTPNHQVIGVMVIGRNISALMDIEQQLEESRTELRGLIKRNEMVREEERKRIAREVHDELGQILTSLQLDVFTLTRKFGHDLPALREHLTGTLELVDKSLAISRNVASALRPASLDMGIVFAIEWLIGKFAKNTGINCKMHVHGKDRDLNLSENANIALFRITQESLTNVARHAKASKVDVTIRKNKGDYILEVRDNGIGINFDGAKKESFGLVGIRERVHLLDGQLSIDSVVGRGTAISVRIPIRNI